MSAIATITVFDGQATPVAHVLDPVSVSREGASIVRAEWRETGLAVPINAQPRLSIRLELLKSGVYRAERKLVVPVMEAVAGQNAAGYTAAPKVAHELTDTRVWFFSQRSDVAGRRLIKQMGTNLDSNKSNTGPAITSGVVDDLAGLLVAPT